MLLHIYEIHIDQLPTLFQNVKRAANIMIFFLQYI